MNRRVCEICYVNKINILASLFGLRHCQECETKPLDDEIARLKWKELKLRAEIDVLQDKGEGQ